MATIGTRLSPLAATDTTLLEKTGITTTINTRLQVMSAMKEFEHYSLEELRDWDYETDKVTKGNIRGAQGFFESMKNTQVNDDAKLFSAGVILTPSNGPRESDAVGTPRSYEMVPTGDTGLVLYPKTCMQCVVDMAAFRLLSIEELRFNDYRLLQLTSRFNPGTRKKIFTYPKGSEEEVVLGETLIFSTQLVCITAISEYMDFSLEELRYIDSFEQHHVPKLKQSIKEDIERTPMPTDASNWPRPTKGFYFSSPESQDCKGRFPEQRECLEHIEKGSDCVHVEKGPDCFFPESFSEKNILTDESVNAIQNVVFAEVIAKGSDYVSDYSSDSSESL